MCTPRAPTRTRRPEGARTAGADHAGRTSARFPDKVVETDFGWTSKRQAIVRNPDPDVLVADVYTDGSGQLAVTPEELRWSLAMGAGTPGWCQDVGQSEVTRVATARMVAAAWVLQTEPYEPGCLDEFLGWVPSADVTHLAYEALLALPEDTQQERVAAYREAELTCASVDRPAILLSGGS